jgi:Spx/MgsR family transcriptional regulator
MSGKLIFYTYPSDTSCRKAKAILRDNEIPFEERHLFRDPPSKEELLEMLKLTTSGIDQILSKRSQTFKELKVNIDDMKLSEMLDLLHKEPKLLRRPLLLHESKLIIGFNREVLEELSA